MFKDRDPLALPFVHVDLHRQWCIYRLRARLPPLVIRQQRLWRDEPRQVVHFQHLLGVYRHHDGRLWWLLRLDDPGAGSDTIPRAIRHSSLYNAASDSYASRLLQVLLCSLSKREATAGWPLDPNARKVVLTVLPTEWTLRGATPHGTWLNLKRLEHDYWGVWLLAEVDREVKRRGCQWAVHRLRQDAKSNTLGLWASFHQQFYRQSFVSRVIRRPSYTVRDAKGHRNIHRLGLTHRRVWD